MTATLLLIDDNAIQAATRQTILKRSGYHVIAALNPERALEQFRRSDLPAPIDLIITDHMMPGMNGAEFVTQIRTISQDIPVLVISGLAEAEDAYTGLNVQFRLKPLMPDDLIACVREMLPPIHSYPIAAGFHPYPQHKRRRSHVLPCIRSSNLRE